MNTILEQIVPPSVSFFLLLGLAVMAILIPLKLHKKQKPIWSYKAVEITPFRRDTPPHLKLFYKNTQVDSVYRTRLIFFNKGKQVIDRKDVTEKIAIKFQGSKILCKPDIIPNKEAIQFSAKRTLKGKDSFLQLDFRYLGHNDGAVIDILHTKAEKIDKCSGDLKEVDITKMEGFDQHLPPFYRSQYVMTPIIMVSMTIILLNMVMRTEELYSKIQEDRTILPMIIGVIALSAILLVFGLIKQLSHRRFPTWSRKDESSTK